MFLAYGMKTITDREKLWLAQMFSPFSSTKVSIGQSCQMTPYRGYGPLKAKNRVFGL